MKKSNIENHRKRPIGIFDSGIGGLTVVRKILEILPDEDIVYFGDTARVPYGNKSADTIKKFSMEIINFLTLKKIKLIITACNTVSAIALEWLKVKYDIPILGVIEPGAKEAVKRSKNKRIGVVGTRATIESSAYKKALTALNHNVKVHSKSCPLLVPLVEEGWTEGLSTVLIIEHYLKPLKAKGIDTLILGCTHYPLLQKEIEKVVGNTVKVIDSASAVAIQTKEVLKNNGLYRKFSDKPEHLFYFSDIQRGFSELSKRFLGQTIKYRRTSLS